MRSVAKLTRRFVGILSLSTLLLLAVNLVILVVLAAYQTPGAGPWTTAGEAARALRRGPDGYVLGEDMTRTLEEENAWAVYIDDDTMEVLWHSEDLPEEIPLQYTASDISRLTRGYVADYPTFTGSGEDGLMVVGFPKDRYWKLMNPSWDYYFIKNAPAIALSVLGINVAVIFLIYILANAKLLRSVTPIANGVQALPTQEPVYVKERGLLSDLAKDINQTAEILRSQRADLRKKETARADWISGVSHDIRTPLSMVMGYAGQLEDDPDLSGETRRKASVIRQQSTKIKNLIHDLNLASKLEYNMQPLHPQPVNLIAVARQCAADFLNADLEGKYPLQWRAPEHIPACILQGDPNLLHRALENLLHNAQSHNPDGCRITLEVSVKAGACCIAVSDDGVGMTDKQLEKLQNTPHYMMNDAGIAEPRHGLGLLIVQQIVRAHHGTTRFSSVHPHGFCVAIQIPLSP